MHQVGRDRRRRGGRGTPVGDGAIAHARPELLLTDCKLIPQDVGEEARAIVGPVRRMIEDKRELAQRIVGTGEAWINDLSIAQLRDLVALSDDAVAEA